MEQIILSLNVDFVVRLHYGFAGDRLIFVNLVIELREVIKMLFVLVKILAH
jgi:hypothetical protein